MVMDHIAMANSPLLYWGVVEDESPPLHPIEKEKSKVLDQVAMANSRFPEW